MRLSCPGVCSAALALAVVGAAPAAPVCAQSARSVVLANEAEATAAIFVLEDYLSGDNDIERIADLYAENAEYFDLGLQPREAILRDKEAYLERWPERLFTPDLDTLEVRNPGPNLYEVDVEVDYAVWNPESAASGRALVTLTLMRHGDRFKITRERGATVPRARSAEPEVGR